MNSCFLTQQTRASPLCKGGRSRCLSQGMLPRGQLRESLPPCLQPPLPVPLRDCGFSTAGAWKQPHKGRQRGQGHPYPRLHSSESSQHGAPMRIKAGTDMPVVMRSPLLDRAAMLKLASNNPGKEHQSLQALSSCIPENEMARLSVWGRSGEKSRASVGWAEAELAHEGLQGNVAESAGERAAEDHRAEQRGKEGLPAQSPPACSPEHARMGTGLHSPPWGEGLPATRTASNTFTGERGRSSRLQFCLPCAGCSLRRCSCVCSEGEMAADKSYSQAISPKRLVKAAIAVLHCIHVLPYHCQSGEEGARAECTEIGLCVCRSSHCSRYNA